MKGLLAVLSASLSVGRLAVVTLFAAASLLLVTTASSHAQTLSYGAQFAVDDVDPWGPGGAGVHRASQAYDVAWNEHDSTSSTTSVAGATFGGTIGGATSGHLGVEFGYDAVQGKLDIDYPALVDVTYPDDETYFPGDTLRISTVNRSAAGSFDFDPGAQDYSIDTRLALTASATGELCFVTCFGSMAFFPAISIPEEELEILRAHGDAGQYGPIYAPNAAVAKATHISGSVTAAKPDVALDVSEQGRMVANSSNQFAALELDVDGFSRYPFGKSTPSSFPVSGSYDVIDGEIQLNADENHSFDFRPVVRLTFAFPRSITYRVVDAAGVVGAAQVGTSATIDAGQSLDLVLPVDQTQPFTITPTLSLSNTLHHTLEHVYQLQGNLEVLRASVSIPSFEVIPGFEICDPFGVLGCYTVDPIGFPGVSIDVGPVYQKTIPITTGRPGLFDRTWPIVFQPHVQAARGFDPENVPVAEAGGPYDLDEGTSRTLDGTASFDYDADDILTYAWKLDAPGALEAAGSTPRFDGLDGEQAYVATLTVCDLKQNCDDDTATVHVHNVAPTHLLDTTSTIAFGVGQAFLARNGVSVRHSATGRDQGTDDTTYAWSAGAYASWAPPTTTLFNDGRAADLKPSPFGVLPFATTNASTVTFSQPGVHDLRVMVSDDDAGSTSTTVPVLVADSSTTYRPYGWFKQQYSLKGQRVLSTVQLDAYLAFTRAGSSYFAERQALLTSADAYAVLQRLDTAGVTALDQARAMTLTAWLNVASGAVDFHSALPARVQQPGRRTTADALREVEAVMASPTATQKQLLEAMQLAHAIGG